MGYTVKFYTQPALKELMYAILENGIRRVSDIESVELAIQRAEELLILRSSLLPVTYSVHSDSGFLHAAVTNRQIQGVFIKQQPGDTAADQSPIFAGVEHKF